MYQGVADIEGAAYYDNALRLRDMGRLLLATEVSRTLTIGLDAHRVNQIDSTSFSLTLLLSTVGKSVYFSLIPATSFPSYARSGQQRRTGTYKHPNPPVFPVSTLRIISPRWWA